MGDPKKTKKKFSKPSHPWNKQRIEEEAVLIKEYGFKNKKELWKMGSLLSRIKSIAKKNTASNSAQAQKESMQQLKKLQRLGLVAQDASLDEILGITLRDLLEKRLQTVVYKKGLARSVVQARQFITHGHISVGDKKVDSPAYLVSVAELQLVTFKQTSKVADPEHPERVVLEKKPEKKAPETPKKVKKDGSKTK